MPAEASITRDDSASWGANAYRVGAEEHLNVGDPTANVKAQHGHIEPWLSAVFQSEHFALLLGSGFTRAVTKAAGGDAAGMGVEDWSVFGDYAEPLRLGALAYAKSAGRGKNANIEDQARAVLALCEGMRVMARTHGETATSLAAIENAYAQMIRRFLGSVLASETVLAAKTGQPPAEDDSDALVLLQAFLLSFASRAASRERLHVFTTNYDRVIEFGCDLAGLHVLDRFVGALEPRFRSSRLDVDLHYNPPGIRGEPRYLEGVIQLTKLHGSLDWRLDARGWVRRVGLPFGAPPRHPAIAQDPADTIMIYPNAAKDRETTEYPYVDLFRDFAAAVCQPNSSIVTYGYGFGDDHMNRVLADMLTIPSSHLVIIAYNDEGGRVSRFCRTVGREPQISLLIGPHFADLQTLCDNYLPKPAIDRITMRQTDLLRNRQPFGASNRENQAGSEGNATAATGPATEWDFS